MALTTWRDADDEGGISPADVSYWKTDTTSFGLVNDWEVR